MCVYCVMGDWAFRHNPPWPMRDPYPLHPLVPPPITPGPHVPWTIDRVKEFADLMRRVKELEDKLGCPCEPNKADYLDLLRQRIEQLEKKAAP